MGPLPQQPRHPDVISSSAYFDVNHKPDAGLLPPTLAHQSLGALEVRVQGLEARPELNGLVGTLVAFDVEKWSWYVDLGGATGKKCFKVNHLELVSVVLNDADDPICPLPPTGDAAPRCVDDPGGDAQGIRPDRAVWRALDALVRQMLAQRRLEDVIKQMQEHQVQSGRTDCASVACAGAGEDDGDADGLGIPCTEGAGDGPAGGFCAGDVGPELAMRAPAEDDITGNQWIVLEDPGCGVIGVAGGAALGPRKPGRRASRTPALGPCMSLQGVSAAPAGGTAWMDWDELFDEIHPHLVTHVSGPRAYVSFLTAQTHFATDILIFGSTGMMGLMACASMQELASGRTWAIAGRDARKLRRLSSKFGESQFFHGTRCIRTARDIECFVRTARVVIDLSGPKCDYTDVLVEACVQSGTHYVDVGSLGSGFLAAKQVRDTFDQRAREAGVCLVHFCGSPATQDLATWLLVRHLYMKYGLPTRRVDAYNYSTVPLGGTSLLEYVGEKGLDEELQKQGFPFLFGGRRWHGRGGDEGRGAAQLLHNAQYDIWSWPEHRSAAPVVHCSAGMFDASLTYGHSFAFEAWSAFSCKSEGETEVADWRALRRDYHKYLENGQVPQPGQGPAKKDRQDYVRRSIFVAEVDEPGERRTAHIAVSLGPGGIGDTAEEGSMIALLAAHCLLNANEDGEDLRPGFGTPAWHLAHLGFCSLWEQLLKSTMIIDGRPSRSFFHAMFDSACPWPHVAK